MKYPKSEVTEALAKLRDLCPPGTTIYTVLRHVSRSGMQREISCYIMQDNEPRWISWLVARVLGEPLGKREGVKVGGCGMDMGFHIVNSLSYALHGTKDHGLPAPDATYTPGSEHERARRQAIHQPTPDAYASGYTLLHRWM